MPRLIKIRKRTTIMISMTLFLLCVVVFYINNRDNAPASSSMEQSLAAPKRDPPSNADTKSSENILDINSRQSISADMESLDRSFNDDYGKLDILMGQDRFSGIKPAIASLMSDSALIHADMKFKGNFCIQKSTDKTVFVNCMTERELLISTSSSLTIDKTLEKLPNVSREQLDRENYHDIQDATENTLPLVEETLKQIEADPEAAMKYGISQPYFEQLAQRANALLVQAQDIENTDPMLCLVLQDHSRLLFDEFTWKTFDYRAMLLEGQPLQR